MTSPTFQKQLSVAEYAAEFFIDKGTTTAFAVAGGASLHLMHAFERAEGGRLVSLHHEQSVAMAVDAYSRSSGEIGLGIATSGPGATNLITGIAGAFYDSIGCIFLTGQVSTFRAAGATGVRQFGFQETPIRDMVRPVCKGTFSIQNAHEAMEIFERAYELAREGRPGPVVVEIPDNIQRDLLNATNLSPRPVSSRAAPAPNDGEIKEVVRLLSKSSRPVLIAGSGVRGEPSIKAFQSFVSRSGIPVALTWGAASLMVSDDPNLIGFFGTHGSRAANLLLRRADLVLSVGSRLDTKATGSPPSTFAPDAVKIMVDIDRSEIEKFQTFGLELTLGLAGDAGSFLEEMSSSASALDVNPWRDEIDRVVKQCEEVENSLRVGVGTNPYTFFAALSEAAPASLDVWVDTGCILPYTMSSLKVRQNTRIFHDFNNTAMGWSIPASIGGFFADQDRQGITLVGDGSLMMGLHDLSTLSSAVKSAKVVLLDNSGYAMIRQTQDQWLGSEYVGSSTETGLHFPEWHQLAAATGFHYLDLIGPNDLGAKVAEFWAIDRPVFLRVQISEAWRVIPQVQAGSPNHIMTPPPPTEYLAELGL